MTQPRRAGNSVITSGNDRVSDHPTECERRVRRVALRLREKRRGVVQPRALPATHVARGVKGQRVGAIGWWE